MSGVSHFDLDISESKLFFVPRDRDDVVHYNFEVLLDDHHRMLRVNWTDSGLTCETLLHASCWTIIERIIGHQAEDRLDLLFQAMKYGWDKNSYDVSGLISSSGSDSWLGYQVLHTTHQYRLVPVTDPIDIPALRTLIAKSRKSLTSTDGIEETSEEDARMQPLPARMPPEPSTIKIPVEIKALILNQLPEWLDAKNALEAFSWELPDFLWRDWIPYDLIFDELDEIPVSEIDWKVLYTGIMRLLNTSLAMKNRQRIVRVVKETREDFLELLKKN